MPSIASLASTKAKVPPQAHYGSFPVRLLCRVSCFQLGAFVLALIGCIMNICPTANIEWRVWQVENIMGSNKPGIVGIGIWGACSVRRITIKKINIICTALNDVESLPSEIITAQDLMPLAIIANAVTVFCMAFALYNIFKPGKHDDFIFTFFSIGAIMDLAAGTCVLISVSWNLYSILANKEMKLPEVLGVPLIPKDQRAGISIYMGFIAAASQLLSGTLVLGEKYLWKTSQKDTSKEKFVTDPENITENESPMLRVKCRRYYSTVKLEGEDQPTPILRRYQRRMQTETH